MALSATDLRKLKVGLFAERATVAEALNYGKSMFPADEPAAVTAMMVMYNTLLEVLAKNVNNLKETA